MASRRGSAAPRAEPQPVPPAQATPDDDLSQPCTIKGLTSAFFAGGLGYFFGIVPAAVKYRAKQWGAINAEGVKSAQTFAIMSGLYTAVQCICQRLRQVDDGFNRAAAGCSTGLVLGWKAGPWGAAQSCFFIGAISYVLDMGGGEAPAHAADLGPGARSRARCCGGLPDARAAAPRAARAGSSGAAYEASSAAGCAKPRHQVQLSLPRLQPAREQLALPPLMWLGACCGQASYFSGCSVGLTANSGRL